MTNNASRNTSDSTVAGDTADDKGGPTGTALALALPAIQGPCADAAGWDEVDRLIDEGYGVWQDDWAF